LEAADFFDGAATIEAEEAAETVETAVESADLPDLPEELSDADLADYINNNIKLSKEVTADNMAEEFSDGYLLGEWLTKEGLQTQDRMASFVANPPTEREGLSNLMRVIPAARNVDVEFTATDARSIMHGKEGAARVLITDLIKALITRKQKGAPKAPKKKLPKGWCTVKDRLDPCITYYENTYTGTRYLCAHFHPPADPAHQMTRHTLEKRLYDPEDAAAADLRAERVAQHRAEIYARNRLIREYKQHQARERCCAQARQRAERVQSDAMVAMVAAVQAAATSEKYAEEVVKQQAGADAREIAAAEAAKKQEINAKRKSMVNAGFDPSDEAIFDALPTAASVAVLNFEALCFPNGKKGGDKGKSKKGSKRKESKQAKPKLKSKANGKQAADVDEKRVCLEFQSNTGCGRGKACPLAHVRIPAELMTLRFQLWLHENARGGWRGEQKSNDKDKGSQKPEDDPGGEASSSGSSSSSSSGSNSSSSSGGGSDEQQIEGGADVSQSKQIQHPDAAADADDASKKEEEAQREREERKKEDQKQAALFEEHMRKTNALVQQNKKQLQQEEMGEGGSAKQLQQGSKEGKLQQLSELEQEEQRLIVLLEREKEKEKELELEQQQLDEKHKQKKKLQLKPLPPPLRELGTPRKGRLVSPLNQSYSRPQRLLMQQQRRQERTQRAVGDVASKSLDDPPLRAAHSPTAADASGAEDATVSLAASPGTIRPKLLNYHVARYAGAGTKLTRSLDSSSIAKLGMNDIKVPPSKRAGGKKKRKKPTVKTDLSSRRLPKVESYSRV
jgi:hypothetical protein